MVISRFSVKLERLGAHQLELLRYWRNNEYIARYMDYKTFITKEMQQKWFAKVDNKCHFYFIIEHEGTPVGLINTAHIDWASKSGEAGLFIWDDKCINSPVPVYASLCMLDVFFLYLGFNSVSAKVKNDNDRAIAYNSALGFVFKEIMPCGNFSLYLLTKDRYFQHAHKLRQSALKLFGNETLINLSMDNSVDAFIHGVLSASVPADVRIVLA